MKLQDHLFKPSSMITFLLIVIFVLLAIVTIDGSQNTEKFYEIVSSSIKILAGALAGAVAGEKYAGDKK